MQNNAIAYPDEELLVRNLTVNTNASLRHRQGQDNLTISIEQNATIEADGKINLDGVGYLADTGPGAGASAYYSGGAAHGGNGANSSYTTGGSAYGSILAPTELGSGGGGGGGIGGGALRLIAGGTLLVDGEIRAGGFEAGGHAGGGAGGSLYLTVGVLAGSGTISANGGNVNHASAGCGAGGRIAIEYGANDFTGNIATRGGSNGNYFGGAGTIYTKQTDATVGHVLVDNSDARGAWTPLTSPEAFHLTIANDGVVYPSEPLTITSLDIAPDGLLTHVNATSNVTVTVNANATIQSGGALDVSARGYPAGAGPGAGGSAYYSAGAGHGGNGAGSSSISCGGGAYDDVLAPSDYGSGGGSGSRGGGTVRLVVADTLLVDGELRSDAATASSNGGGGAGGSLYLTVGTLAGGGAISANGGNISDGNAGCGAGGRIAIEYDLLDFAGSIEARGGNSGNHRGSAGTIYTRDNAQPVGLLRIDNEGVSGAWTPITSPEAFDLIIANQAIAYPADVLNLTNLTVDDNGLLTHPSRSDVFVVNVAGDAIVTTGGLIAANGRGWSANEGPGVGATAYYSGGGGYGGMGGNSAYTTGGATYGRAVEPTELGSGGGDGSGGAGGGKIRITVANTLQVDGAIQANGNNASSHGGGGSGGSVFIITNTLTGLGTIAANGGNINNGNCGGGGGGRIAIYTPDLQLDLAQLTVAGGNGYDFGDEGTIYIGTDVPLYIRSATPEGIVGTAVDSLTVKFNREIDPTSFTLDDITLTDPDGLPVTITQPPVDLGENTWQIDTPTLSADGIYTLSVGPQVTTPDGGELDQDGDGVFGEDPDDIFVHTFTLDLTPPEIIAQSPATARSRPGSTTST